MSFFVESSGGGFQNCPPGMHLARNYQIIDLGTQKDNRNGVVEFKHRITLTWEILSKSEDGTPLRMNDGRPFSVNKRYNLTWAERSTLRNDLQSWRGRPFTNEELRKFDLKRVLGQYCMINVLHNTSKNGKVYANVEQITPVPGMIKGAGLPPGVNPDVIFNLSDPDMNVFESLTPWLKKTIQESPEWQKLNGKTALVDPDQSLRDAEEYLDQVPF